MKAMPVVVCLLLFTLFSAAQQSQQVPTQSPTATPPLPPSHNRHFQFEYAFTVRNPEPGGKLRIWFPMAISDAHQQIKIVSTSGDLPLRREHESEYGNGLFYAETAKADRTEYHFKVVYDIERRENRGDKTEGPKVLLGRFVQQDKLVPVAGLMAEMAKHETEHSTPGIDQARAVYDYVFKTLR